jgi:hypothetical protein
MSWRNQRGYEAFVESLTSARRVVIWQNLIERRVVQAMIDGKLAVGALAALVLMTGTASAQVVVSSKIDTEGGVLGNVIKQVLENNDIAVEDRIQLGATPIMREAIIAGEIDIYPEYTGNGAFFFDRADEPIWNNAAEAYDTVARLDYEANKIVWLTPSPANNTWAVALRSDLAEANGLTTFSEFGAWVASGGAVKLAASCPAEIPGSLWLYADAGPIGRAVGRRYGRDNRCGGAADQWRQCRHGLWHGRRDQRVRARRARGRQGRTARLSANPDHPGGRAEAISADRGVAEAGVRSAQH